MTVLSSETRLIGSGTALLPRVNLLPPEIAEQRAFRRVQVGLGAAGAASVGLVALLFVSASHGLGAANSDLATAKSQNATLQTQQATYRNVTAVYAAAAAAQSQLGKAMGDEVRFSQLLNDLALSVPSTVWMKNVSYTVGVPAVGTSAASPTGAPAVGTFTVTGVGFSHDDVAMWLESIASLKTYSNPYFSNSTEVLLGTRRTVNFATTANLTPAALSGRYNKPAGG